MKYAEYCMSLKIEGKKVELGYCAQIDDVEKAKEELLKNLSDRVKVLLEQYPKNFK